MSSLDPPPRGAGDEARDIGVCLKLLRESKGLSQEEAGERMGVSRQAWWNYEQGRSVVLRTDLQRRAVAALGATLEDLQRLLRNYQRSGLPISPASVGELGAVYSGPGRTQAVFPTPDGDAILSVPANMSGASQRALKSYLATFLDQLGQDDVA